MSIDKRLAIVIPTYNEIDNIFNLISQIGNITERQDLEVIIIIVDDNSPDGTANLIIRNKDIIEKNFKFLKIDLIKRSEKLGIGSAYIKGFHHAIDLKCDYILQMDADFSHQPKYIPLFLESIKKSEVVIGSRYIRGGKTENWCFLRKSLSKAASLYARTILGMKVQDMTGGYVMYKLKVLEALDLNSVKSNGYSFQIEIKFMAYKNKFIIKEIPIIFPDRVKGKSKMERKIIINAFLRVIQLKFLK